MSGGRAGHAGPRKQFHDRRGVPLRPAGRNVALAQQARADVAQAQLLGAELLGAQGSSLLVPLDVDRLAASARRGLWALGVLIAGALQNLYKVR